MNPYCRNSKFLSVIIYQWKKNLNLKKLLTVLADLLIHKNLKKNKSISQINILQFGVIDSSCVYVCVTRQNKNHNRFSKIGWFCMFESWCLLTTDILSITNLSEYNQHCHWLLRCFSVQNKTPRRKIADIIITKK